MSEKYMPFDYNSTAPDPSVYEYTATDERIFNLSNFTNGVFPETKFVESGNIVTSTYLGGSLAVTAGEGLSVSVSPGVAMVEGVKYWNSETKNIAFEQNNVEQVFDIVVELDTINQRVLAKKKIRTSGIAVTEDLLRSDSIYQLAIATVAIPANAAAITAAMITDQRLNTNLCADGKPVCGLVGAVSQLDFSVLYNQIMDWFDHLKGNLSEDAALNLQTQVDALKGSFAHSKSGAIHTLTGSFPVSTGITAIKFKATAGYTAGDTFTVNGTAYTASMQGGDALDKDAFISGDVVQVGVDLDGHKLVFKGGGGLKINGATEVTAKLKANFNKGDKGLLKPNEANFVDLGNRGTNIWIAQIPGTAVNKYWAIGKDNVSATTYYIYKNNGDGTLTKLFAIPTSNSYISFVTLMGNYYICNHTSAYYMGLISETGSTVISTSAFPWAAAEYNLGVGYIKGNNLNTIIVFRAGSNGPYTSVPGYSYMVYQYIEETEAWSLKASGYNVNMYSSVDETFYYFLGTESVYICPDTNSIAVVALTNMTTGIYYTWTLLMYRQVESGSWVQRNCWSYTSPNSSWSLPTYPIDCQAVLKGVSSDGGIVFYMQDGYRLTWSNLNEVTTSRSISLPTLTNGRPYHLGWPITSKDGNSILFLAPTFIGTLSGHNASAFYPVKFTFNADKTSGTFEEMTSMGILTDEYANSNQYGLIFSAHCSGGLKSFYDLSIDIQSIGVILASVSGGNNGFTHTLVDSLENAVFPIENDTLSGGAGSALVVVKESGILGDTKKAVKIIDIA